MPQSRVNEFEAAFTLSAGVRCAGGEVQGVGRAVPGGPGGGEPVAEAVAENVVSWVAFITGWGRKSAMLNFSMLPVRWVWVKRNVTLSPTVACGVPGPVTGTPLMA